MCLSGCVRAGSYFLTTSLSEAAKWAAACLEGAGRPFDAERIRYLYAPHMEQHVG